MKHKKTHHPILVPACEKFSKGQCERAETECWFEHKQNEKKSYSSAAKPSEEHVFQEALGKTFPPDPLIEMIRNLCKKVETMEKKFENLMN